MFRINFRSVTRVGQVIIKRFGICYMFVCIVPLSQSSSRDLDHPFWDNDVLSPEMKNI